MAGDYLVDDLGGFMALMVSSMAHHQQAGALHVQHSLNLHVGGVPDTRDEPSYESIRSCLQCVNFYWAVDYIKAAGDAGDAGDGQVSNARQLEGSKGLLGVVNWASEKLLNAAHLRRSNTREGWWLKPGWLESYLCYVVYLYVLCSCAVLMCCAHVVECLLHSTCHSMPAWQLW